MSDNVQGKDYDGNVRTDVEDRGDIENRCYIYAATCVLRSQILVRGVYSKILTQVIAE